MPVSAVEEGGGGRYRGLYTYIRNEVYITPPACRPHPPWSLVAGDLVAAERSTGRPLHPPGSIRARRLTLTLYFPFCRRLCSHCLYPVMEACPGAAAWYRRMVAAEARLYAGALEGLGSVAVHITGGSPCIVPPSYWAAVVEEVSSVLGVGVDAVVMDTGPWLPGEEFMAEAADAGVSEIFVGVDTLDEALQASIGKIFDERILSSILDSAEEFGVSVTFTVLHSLPGQRLSQWLTGLRSLLELGAYSIEVRPYSTPGACRPAPGILYRRMVLQGDELLTSSGYERSGCCRYMLGAGRGADWRGSVDTLGLGPGAHTFIGLHEHWNTLSPSGYSTLLGKGLLPAAAYARLTRRQRAARVLAEQLFRWGALRDETILRRLEGTGIRQVVRAMRALGRLSPRGGLMLTRRGLPDAQYIYWAYRISVEGVRRAVNPGGRPMR